MRSKVGCICIRAIVCGRVILIDNGLPEMYLTILGAGANILEVDRRDRGQYPAVRRDWAPVRRRVTGCCIHTQ